MFLVESVLFGLFVLPFVIIALFINRKQNTSYAFLFLSLLILDDALTALPLVYESLLIPGSDWNWTGKLLSIAWALIFVKLSPFTFKEIGLTLKQNSGSVLPAAIVTLIAITISITIGFIFAGNEPFEWEEIAYQLTMPGLAEELTYRGVFLVLLHYALPSKKGKLSFWFPAIITTIAFGLWHGLIIDGWQVSFNFMVFLFPFFGGIAFVWLREKTGSLLFPLIAHNGCNVVISLISMA